MPEPLEVHDPGGAFARIEGWLAERGFFGPGSDGLVAEPYLGYGLSEAIRRGTEPPPPEPCRPLPLAACRVGGDVGRGSRGSFDVDLALTIRMFAIAEGSIHLWVGGGVVWDSDPSAEVEESWTKAMPLLEAAGSRMPEAALS